ncbi:MULTISPECIES: hypothetical protein [Streptomyces]|uniref:hypothetical protein n=1 Tax=Streptomyces lycopersici TaxID=2974589 RepID=UPI0021D03A83|nr:hypothetical protein [Streptomyces sp. NEAU-383]
MRTEAAEEAVRLVRERLSASAEGRMALARLEEEPQQPAAQEQARTLLADELLGDAGFARQLAEALTLPSVNSVGSVVIGTGKVIRSTIGIGPIAIARQPSVHVLRAVVEHLPAVLLGLAGVLVFTAPDGAWSTAALAAIWGGCIAVGVMKAYRRGETRNGVVAPGRSPRPRRAAALFAGLTDAAVFLTPRTAVPTEPSTRKARLHDAYNQLGPPPRQQADPLDSGASG